MPSALPASPFLYPILDLDALGSRTIGEAIVALARAGVGIVQIRAKHSTDRLLLEASREALHAARAARILFIVNDRPDLALVIGADGVHLGQDDLPPAMARQLLGPEAIIGWSTHSLEQLGAAAGEPVDYVAIGPVYSTSSKMRPDPVVGPAMLRQARRLVDRPLVAIGGITLERSREVVEAGANGVAVISALLGAPDLSETAARFIRSLRTSSPS